MIPNTGQKGNRLKPEERAKARRKAFHPLGLKSGGIHGLKPKVGKEIGAEGRRIMLARLHERNRQLNEQADAEEARSAGPCPAPREANLQRLAAVVPA